jgi:hypothetical protein
MSRYFGSIMSRPLFEFQHARLDRPVLDGIHAGRAGKEARALGFLPSSEIALIADFDVGRSSFAPLSGATARQVSACHAEAFGVGGLDVC